MHNGNATDSKTVSKNQNESFQLFMTSNDIETRDMRQDQVKRNEEG